MENIRNYIFGFLIISSLFSCKKKMEELNTNPYLLNDANPEYLFTGATVDLNMTSRGLTSNKYGNTMRYMQYIVSNSTDPQGLAGSYWVPGKATGPNPGFPYYNSYYTAIGRDMNRLIAKIDAMPEADKAQYQSLKAICQILNVYHAWRIADIYGAMPYSKAFQDKTVPLPEYDYNWDLYKTFEATLKGASTTLKTATNQFPLGNQDLFFGGDYAKWLGVSNAIRIKIAQRFEKRDAAQLASVLTDIATNFGNGIMSSNDGSFAINHTRDWNNNVDDINVILFEYSASYPFVEYLKKNNDPRIGFMLRENDMGTNSTQYNTVQTNGTAASKAALLQPENQVRYWGKHPSPNSGGNAGYGSTGGDKFKTFPLNSGTQSLTFLSSIQSRLFIKNGGFGGFNGLSDRALMHSDETYVDGASIKMKTFFLTYPDVCFMMAEIAAKGGNGLGKTAEQWYRAGIQASFDLYKSMAVATNVPNAANITIGKFAQNLPYQGLPSIYSQQWVNNLLTPDEAWATWKRTGYPQFTDVRAGNNGNIGTSSIAYLENLWDGGQNLLLPRRNTLDRTSDLNATNYQNAIDAMIKKDASYGANSQDTKGRIWWDVQ